MLCVATPAAAARLRTAPRRRASLSPCPSLRPLTTTCVCRVSAGVREVAQQQREFDREIVAKTTQKGG